MTSARRAPTTALRAIARPESSMWPSIGSLPATSGLGQDYAGPLSPSTPTKVDAKTLIIPSVTG